jgi:hypothetical protein
MLQAFIPAPVPGLRAAGDGRDISTTTLPFSIVRGSYVGAVFPRRGQMVMVITCRKEPR